APEGRKIRKKSVAPPGLIFKLARNPRAYARGYDLSPLCGSNRMRFARYLGQHWFVFEQTAPASLREGIPALLRRGMSRSRSTIGQQPLAPGAKICRGYAA